MKYSIDFNIATENSTLIGNIIAYSPSPEDGRVYAPLYEISTGVNDELGRTISGMIRCYNEQDAKAVINNLKTLAESNASKVTSGYIRLHNCYKDEGNKLCEKGETFWSKQ